MAVTMQLSVSESDVPSNRAVNVTAQFWNSGAAALSVTSLAYSIKGAANQGTQFPPQQFPVSVPPAAGGVYGTAYVTWNDVFFNNSTLGSPDAQAVLGVTATLSDGTNISCASPAVNVSPG